MKLMRKFFGKLNLGFRIAIAYWKISLKLKSNAFVPNNKTAVFDLKVKRMDLRYALLFHCFSEAGYNVIVKDRFLFVGSFFRFTDSNLLAKVLFRRNIKKYLPKSEIYFYDHSQPITKGTLLSINKYDKNGVLNNIYVLPIGMIEHLYNQELNEKIRLHRTNKKKIKVFWSGNTHPKSYDRPVFHEFYKINNRVEITNTLTDKIRDVTHIVTEPQFWENFNNTLNTYNVVVAPWVWSKNSSKNLDIRIKNESWLTILSQACFFVHAPGVWHPMCNSFTESMSLGVIPITQFPHFHNPPLQHGINCVVFSDLDDLVQKIYFALNMNESQINFLSANALEYYEKNLKCKAVAENLVKIKPEICSFHSNISIIEYLNIKDPD